MILALVPRDLLHQLPVPKRIRTYLDTPFYYSETIADWVVPGNEPMSSNLSKDEEVDDTKTVQNSSDLHTNAPREDQNLPVSLHTETEPIQGATQTYQDQDPWTETMAEFREAGIKASIASKKIIDDRESANQEKIRVSSNPVNHITPSPIISVLSSSPLSIENVNLNDISESEHDDDAIRTCDAKPNCVSNPLFKPPP